MPPAKKPTPVEKIAAAENKASDVTKWEKKIARKRVPVSAAELVPDLKAIFAEEGVPPQLVWIAEVESSFDPSARSPVGAVGLFQFMPQTAQYLGLSIDPPDERKDPEKNARAAARYLKHLHNRFGSWPLTFAAYNAGQGRVAGLLKKHKATTFEEISRKLPLETRMYVPKIIATVKLREGVDVRRLKGPRA